MLKPVFYKRDYTLNTFQAPWLKVTKADWDEIGGCDSAELAGWNLGRVDLAQALSLLRCGVELTDESEIPCWWGYVERIELYNSRQGVICDLDKMSNRIRVRYMLIDYSGLDYRLNDQQLLTTWWENLVSQSIYGIKETNVSLDLATLGQGDALKKTLLAERAWPVARPVMRAGSEQGDLFIVLKGWWHSTAWRYYEQEAGVIENYALDSGAIQDLGAASGNQGLAQSFAVGAVGWSLFYAWAQVAKIGTPADNVVCSLHADSAGSPGIQLDTASVSNTVISKGYGWTVFSFPSGVALAANTTYWLRLGRSEATNGTNFYRVKVDDDLKFTGGSLKLYNGLTWAARSPDADLVFRISGLMQTTDQLSLMAAAGCGGQFLGGVQIDQASGVYSNPWRSGMRTAQVEMAELIKTGTSTGGRLICEVTRERVLRVYQAPAKTTAVYRVNGQGYLTDARGYPLPAWAPAAGAWVILENPWLGGGSPNMEISDRFYMERAEYDAKTGWIKPGSFFSG